MNWIKLFSAAVLLVVLTACASSIPKPVVDFKPDYDFDAIRTYAFAPGESINADTLTGGRVIKAIENEMQLKGIQSADPGAADVLIRFMLTTENKQDIRTYDSYYGGAYRCWRCGYPGHPAGYSTEVQVTNYTEGTLVIDLVDPTMKRAIWHAISVGKVQKNNTPEERDQRVRAIVQNMMSAFPPH